MFIRSNTGTANIKRELLRKIDDVYFINNIGTFIHKFIVIKYYDRYYVIYVDSIRTVGQNNKCIITSVKDLPTIISKKMKGQRYACKLFGLDILNVPNLDSLSRSAIKEVWEFKINEKKTNIRR